MCELANHLSASAMLDQQCILAADLITPSDIGHFNQQGCIIEIDWRYTTLDTAFAGVHFGRREMDFVRIVVAGGRDPAEDLAELRFVIDQLQQGFSACAVAADAKNVLGCRIEVGNEQVVIQQDDARVQAVENLACVVVERAVARTSAL